MYVWPAVTLSGAGSATVCQPVGVSLVAVAVASRVPVDDHTLTVCVPRFCGPLWNLTWVILPFTAGTNLKPSSPALVSVVVTFVGVDWAKNDAGNVCGV